MPFVLLIDLTSGVGEITCTNFLPDRQNASINPWGATSTSQFAPTTWAIATVAAGTGQSSTNNPFVTTTAPTYPVSATFNGTHQTLPQQTQSGGTLQQQQHAFAHGRSHSIDTGEMSSQHWQQTYQLRKPDSTSSYQSQNGAVSSTSSASSSNLWPTSAPAAPFTSVPGPGVDPFDVAWAAKSLGKPGATSTNTLGSKSVKQFEVKL